MKKEESVFNIIGYAKDYYVGDKLIGSIVLDKPDREVYGYPGKKTETLKEDIVFKNKKLIKKGTQVTTECIVLCGQMKKSFFGILKRK
jgi:hypothetical protein